MRENLASRQTFIWATLVRRESLGLLTVVLAAGRRVATMLAEGVNGVPGRTEFAGNMVPSVNS